MSIETLRELERAFDYTEEDPEIIEDKIDEEIEEMLDTMSKTDIEEKLDELEDPEFRAIVSEILYQN